MPDPAQVRGGQQVADAALADDERAVRVAGRDDRLGRAEVEVACVVGRPAGGREEAVPVQHRAEAGHRVAPVVGVSRAGGAVPVGDPQAAVRPDNRAAGPPDGALPAGRGVPAHQRAVAVQGDPDDAADVGAAVARQPAERGVNPPVVEGEGRALLVPGGLVRRGRLVEVASDLDLAVGRGEPEQHVLVSGRLRHRVDEPVALVVDGCAGDAEREDVAAPVQGDCGTGAPTWARQTVLPVALYIA